MGNVVQRPALDPKDFINTFKMKKKAKNETKNQNKTTFLQCKMDKLKLSD